jgi:hypothetical protein
MGIKMKSILLSVMLKHYRSNWHNQGVMVREIDIIRKQEGW